MNELDQAHLQERLSQLHEQRLKESSPEDDQGMETGYVTDSSINSRKGTQPRNEQLCEQNCAAANKTRMTKSERDKRRSSRVSLLDSRNDSGSENSSENTTEEKQHRYRKRAGSKRVEAGMDANCNKENVVDANRRLRAGSKNVPPSGSNRLSLPPGAVEQEQAGKLEENLYNAPSTQTLKMNGKDIYCGTWNPKERAVLDQVLNNMDSKADGKKSFMGKFKWGGNSNKSKENKSRKEKCNKIEEGFEQESPYQSQTNSIKHSSSNSSYTQMNNERNHQKKHIKLGLFRKFKDSVRQKHADIEDAYVDRQLQSYGIISSPASQKKRGLFSRLSSSKKKETGGEHSVGSPGGRRRAHSSNDYARCVGVYIAPEEPIVSKNSSKENGNLSKGKSGSIKNIFASSSSRAKSMENLNGAFEYYANPKQVFQRTPSMSKLNSRTTSMERLNQLKRSGSQKSLDHAFEPVNFTTKELCYNDPLVYAQARFVQPQKANQRNIYFPRQISSDGYCSAYDEDPYHRGYQSDRCYQDGRSPSTASRYQQHFTFDMPPPPHTFSDMDGRPQSSMAMYPAYFPSPPPPPPRRVATNGYYVAPVPSNQQLPLSPYFLPPQHAPPMPGYYTPGYATPKAIYARSGYDTPTGMQSGYTSESDYGYMQPPSPLVSRGGPAHQQQGGHPMSMMPHQARRAIQRSLSKNSSGSNYGYASESSFCEEDPYSMAAQHHQQFSQQQQQQQSGPHFYEQQTNSSRTCKTSQLTSDV